MANKIWEMLMKNGLYIGASIDFQSYDFTSNMLGHT